MSRNGGKVLDGMAQKDLHLGTPGVQSTCAHQCSTSVPTRPCQHNEMFTARIASKKAHPRKMGQVAASIFHHLDQLNANICHHCTVHFNHLFSGHIRYSA